MAQIRANDEGLILQQLRYAEEVRSLAGLGIPKAEVSRPELQLALQLVEQIAADEFDPTQFEDEEKARVLAAIDEKVKGRQMVASSREEDGGVPGSGQVIDLMDALRASLGGGKAKAAPKSPSNVTALKPKAAPPPARKAAKRVAAEPEAAPAPRRRAQK